MARLAQGPQIAGVVGAAMPQRERGRAGLRGMLIPDHKTRGEWANGSRSRSVGTADYRCGIARPLTWEEHLSLALPAFLPVITVGAPGKQIIR